jgi:DNA-binding phage protein
MRFRVRDALGLVAHARGMSGIVKKASGEPGNPEFGTVMR